MLIILGTAVLASASAIMLARKTAKVSAVKLVGQQLEITPAHKRLELASSLTAGKAVAKQSKSSSNLFKAGTVKPVSAGMGAIDKVRKGIDSFTALAESRDKSEHNPFSDSAKSMVQELIPVMLNIISKNLSADSIDEKSINTGIKMHDMIASRLLKNYGWICERDLEETMRNIRKINNLMQGRMDREYLEILAITMGLTLQESIRALTLYKDGPSFEMTLAFSKELRKNNDKLEKYLRSRLNF